MNVFCEEMVTKRKKHPIDSSRMENDSLIIKGFLIRGSYICPLPPKAPFFRRSYSIGRT